MLTNWNDGHNHLYLYSYDKDNPGSTTAKLERQLTSGDFEVGEIYAVDFQGKHIEFASNEGNPLEQQLWRVGFDGKRKQLSAGAGFHTGNFAPAGARALSTRQSSRLDPPTLRLCQTAGKCNLFWQTRALESYHLRAPEQLEVKAHDGTTLYATLLLARERSRGQRPAHRQPLRRSRRADRSSTAGATVCSSTSCSPSMALPFCMLTIAAWPAADAPLQQAAWHNFGPVQLEDQLTVWTPPSRSIRSWTPSASAGGDGAGAAPSRSMP